MSKCEVCGNDYESKRASSRFCSSTCRSKANRVSVATEVSVAASDPVSVATPASVRTPIEELHAMEPGIDLDLIGIRTLDLVKDLNLDIRKDLGCMGFSPDGIFILPDITIDQVRTIRRLIEAKRGWTPRKYDNAPGLYTSGSLISR